MAVERATFEEIHAQDFDLHQHFDPRDVHERHGAGQCPRDALRQCPAINGNHVAWAADSDMHEMQSSKLALIKARYKAMKDFAREMIADHTTTTRA